jgi:NAD-dependent DNA ligase
MKFICENKIGPGSKVKVTRSGDVVPFIMEVLHPSTVADYDEWFTEKTLQYGYTHWTETGVDLVLDDANSKEALYGQLVDFFDAIKAPHLGEGNLQKIFDMGFETPESVIMLTQEDLSSLLNSKVNAKKIFNGLREKLTNIPLYLLMGAHNAFGRGVGVRKMKALYDAFNGDMSLCESYSKILDVKGFEHKTATKVQTGYPQFLNFLREVQKVVVIAPYMPPASGNFSGKIVVFTGFRDANLQKLIEQAGGKIGSSISSKTSLVVTNNPDGASSKLDKARELNIPIVGISDIKEML